MLTNGNLVSKLRCAIKYKNIWDFEDLVQQNNKNLITLYEIVEQYYFA